MQVGITEGAEVKDLQDFKRDAIWFMEHYKECKNTIGINKFVAIKDEKPIEKDSHMESLVKKLNDKGIDPSSTFVGFISDDSQVIQ